MNLVRLGAKEAGALLHDDEFLSYVQIEGTKRGDTEGNICTVCWKRCTINSNAGAGSRNKVKHLQNSGCKQPEGSERVAAWRAAEQRAKGFDPADELWSFEDKLEHHADVTNWLVDYGRPPHICKDHTFRLHERKISGGKYDLPDPATIQTLEDIAYDLTFKNIIDSIERAFLFVYGALPYMAIYHGTWTSRANDTYLSIELSFFDPANPEDVVTNITLFFGKLTGGHNANTIALKLTSVMKKFGLMAAELQYQPPQTAKAKGKLGQMSDLSSFVRAQVTDDGGGVMVNVAKECNTPRDWCALHKLDLPGKKALGQSGTDNTRSADEDEARKFMSRMSKMVSYTPSIRSSVHPVIDPVIAHCFIHCAVTTVLYSLSLVLACR